MVSQDKRKPGDIKKKKGHKKWQEIMVNGIQECVFEKL